jgi:hypothetical protein
MTQWPSAPVVYEIDTWPWLTDVSARVGRPVTLADVPAEIWDEVALPGMDAVWLMGVWERSPAGLEVAGADASLQRSFREALPDLRPGDVVGSPYCVRQYRVDDRLGGPGGLAAARRELDRRGLRLILDYVPNHVAADHPAVLEHPDWFIRGSAADQRDDPAAWLAVADQFFARGRDPYFPPWPDVLQLNAFAPGMRGATVGALASIAGQCDGVRCDMAMLLTNDIFARTWGRRVGAPPAEEFWPFVFDRLRAGHPELLLIAEAYWETEWTLQQQGFDLCYDKRLYDRLVHDDADALRKHLAAGRDYQDKLIRFVENHDEPRAAATLPGGRGRAAAVVIATLPGGKLWHDGQFDGRRRHLPVFLGRRPDEPVDDDLREFGHQVVAAAEGMCRGEWRMLDGSGWPDNHTYHNVLAWAWHGEVPRHVVVVNFSAHPSQARIALPWPALAGRRWLLRDLLTDRAFDRTGSELAGDGLFVDLPPWGAHLLQVEPS